MKAFLLLILTIMAFSVQAAPPNLEVPIVVSSPVEPVLATSDATLEARPMLSMCLALKKTLPKEVGWRATKIRTLKTNTPAINVPHEVGWQTVRF